MIDKRETRIDLIRGISLLLIFIGHSSFVFAPLVQHSRGFSDASELFVLMAGISSGLAYYMAPAAGRWFSPGVERPMQRAVTLYGVHISLVLLLVVVALGATLLPRSGEVLSVLNAQLLWQDPILYGVKAIGLQWMPGELDILPLYVVLLLALPVMIALHNRSPRLLLGLSAGLWLFAGVTRVNLTNDALATHVWYFDPFSWQLVFAIGLVIGIRMRRGLDPLPYHPLVFALASMVAVAAVPLALGLFLDVGGLRLGENGLVRALTSKVNVGPVRLVNALAILYCLWQVEAFRTWSRHWSSGVLRAAGRNSLPIFVTGVILSTTTGILSAYGLIGSVLLQVNLMVLGCLIQLRLAEHLEARAVAARGRRAVGPAAGGLAVS